MNKYLTFTLILLIIPFIGFAADSTIGLSPDSLGDMGSGTSGSSGGGLMGLLINFVELINRFVGFLIAAATLVFLWGVLQYVIHGDSESKKTEAKGYMSYGIITLFVMVAVWMITYMLARSFGLSTGIKLPDKKSSIESSIALIDKR